MKKFNFINSSTVVPVAVQYLDEDTLKKTIVYVDYNQDEVYFPHSPELETEEMRRAILNSLDYKPFDLEFHLPTDVSDLVDQIRSGNYGPEIEELRRDNDGDE